MTQDVGKERRRRQRREGTVVDGGLGVESSVEIGKVRFEVAAIEHQLNKDFVSAVIDSKLNTDLDSKDFDVQFASIDKGTDKTVHVAGIDKHKFMSHSFERGLIEKMSCSCCDLTAATPTVTPMLESHSNTATTTVTPRRSTTQRPKRSD